MTDPAANTDQVDLPAPPPGSGDLAPIPIAKRTWTWTDMAGLWASMAACIPSYMLASAAVSDGMSWFQAVFIVILGNLIVLVPIVLNAHPGTRYGIPFPVYCRAAFGIRGAQVPAILRALVACGWFGIQTWIGGFAIFVALKAFIPALDHAPVIPFVGANLVEFACFVGFWLLNMVIIFRGIDSVRFVLKSQAPILILFPIILLIWAVYQAGGLTPILQQKDALAVHAQHEAFTRLFFPTLTAVIGFWSTLALNIPDFSRYSRSQRDQIIGQAIALPTTMGLYALVGVLVTAATIIIYKEPIWDPVQVMAKFGNPWAVLLTSFALIVATLSTNLAANVVGPANDIANINPSKITFKTGALITGCIGILIMPWKLIADPTGYVFTWLIAYSSLLGAICGVILADYYLIRKTRLDLSALYAREGIYWYHRGVNPVAIAALIIGVAPCLPGFLVTIKILTPNATAEGTAWDHFLRTSADLYSYAWFISLALAGLVHVIGMETVGKKR